MQAAMTPIAKPVRIDMLKSSLYRDRFDCAAAARMGRSRQACDRIAAMTVAAGELYFN
jgi:hypothetical protein